MRSVIELERQREGGNGASRLPADPRRRLGRHGEARRLLSADDGPVNGTHGLWDGLLTALRRHTIQSSLATLGESERQVLEMAYLDGRSNREIAAALSVSLSTVRRRISTALARVDADLRRAGTWVSAIVLALMAFAAARSRTAGHLVSELRATPVGNVVLVTTAGAAATAIVVGGVLINQGAVAGSHASTRASTYVTAGGSFLPFAPVQSTTANPAIGSNPDEHAGRTGDASSTSDHPSGALDPGCDGKPTNAPASTPVGPRAIQPPKGSPVTHPGPGGCGPHGVENQ